VTLQAIYIGTVFLASGSSPMIPLLSWIGYFRQLCRSLCNSHIESCIISPVSQLEIQQRVFYNVSCAD